MSRTKTITLTGVTAALVFAATFFLRIPTPLGYVNAGDGIILLTGSLLGGLPGAVAGAVGSAMADLAAGYVVYAPVTAIIKGVMGLLAGVGLSRSKMSLPRLLLVGGLCEILMVVGYFLFEWAMYGFTGAVAAILPNLMQGLTGLLVAFAGQGVKRFFR